MNVYVRYRLEGYAGQTGVRYRPASVSDLVAALREGGAVDRTAFWLVDSYVVNNLKAGRYLVVRIDGETS